jgi:phosphoglycolate phosphatase
VGDSLVDANTAKNAGVDFAAVTTGVTKERDFSGLPVVKILRDLSELCTD